VADAVRDAGVAYLEGFHYPYHPLLLRVREMTRTSYSYRLEAFAAAVREGAPVVTDIDFSVANMTMVDAAYVMAGMKPRQPARRP
jgi:predicted dehydrogenase